MTVAPEGISNPDSSTAEVRQYKRDAKVAAWVRLEADGVCGKPSPFMKTDSLPYLEVHHLRRLADGGSDTITNAVACCPNCHRLMHYGAGRNSALEEVYRRVMRLVRE